MQELPSAKVQSSLGMPKSRRNSRPSLSVAGRRPSLHHLGHNQGIHAHYSLHVNDLLTGYHRAQDNMDLSLTFDFEMLSLTLPSGKTILSGITGRIVPGKVTVIMGPSGAGKSTFMNVLMGKSVRTGGRLLINSREVEMHRYKQVCVVGIFFQRTLYFLAHWLCATR
jgi:ABC-type multidrug transport system fused ATPase/permease subunit